MTIKETCSCGAQTEARGTATYEVMAIQGFRELHKDCGPKKIAELCPDYPAPCNCNNPAIHDGH